MRVFWRLLLWMWLGITIAIHLGNVLLVIGFDEGICLSDYLDSQSSPRTDLLAQVVYRDCGATTLGSTRLDVRSNPPIFDIGRRDSTIFADTARRVRWLGPELVTVDSSRCEAIDRPGRPPVARAVCAR